jgi:gliding motility-associated-like protein
MAKYKLFLWFMLVFCMVETMHSQSKLCSYSFNDCNFMDDAGVLPDIITGGVPQCQCGVGSNGVLLNGVDDYLAISNTLNPFLDEDFTLDFYFWMDRSSGETDIFSLRNGCSNLDSLMSFRYFSDTDELLFEISSNVNNYHFARKKLSSDRCWNRFTLVKFNLEYYVYINNELIRKIISREDVIFSRIARFQFANSPCNSNNLARKFSGRLDEISVYNRAFSELEVSRSYLYPDRIITENTTIFNGDFIQLELGPTCASNVQWSPVISLDNAAIPSPSANPNTTTTYKISVNNGSCVSTDTVKIFVADKDKLDCDKLLLPGAFTPNNDGLNDLYGISNTFIVDDLEYFEIYDRWGSLVWKASSIDDRWDGTLNGQPLNGGMYMYKIGYSCRGEEKVNIDNFTMIR